jgi:carbonic anhydrase
VTSVVVCGHSSCGAMTALLSDGTDQQTTVTTAVGEWLEHAQDSLVAFRDHHPARATAVSNGLREADQLSIVNVAIQMERLARNPILAPAKDSGALKVFGMFFDIATAHVYEVNQNGIVCPTEPAAK